jgi:CheY-like chemotaxis protein
MVIGSKNVVHEPDAQPCYAGEVSTKPKASIRVLFVDDDSATRDGYTALLASSDFDVMAVATGRETLTLANTWAPDVIVLDLGLPDIDGWEVARQLKAAPRTVAIPIIALTGSDLPHERVSAMRAGCDRHLAKPCVPSDLVDAIRRCLGEPA